MKHLLQGVALLGLAAVSSNAQAAEIDVGDFSNPTIVGFGNPGATAVVPEGLAIGPVTFTSQSGNGLVWWGPGNGYADCVGGCVTNFTYAADTLNLAFNSSFALAGLYVGQATAFNLTVSFYDTADALLGSVVASGPGDGVAFAGWSSDGLNIARITVNNANNNGFLISAQSGYFQAERAGVPEPATWAMILLGFGLVGGAMRTARRRQRIAVSYA